MDEKDLELKRRYGMVEQNLEELRLVWGRARFTILYMIPPNFPLLANVLLPRQVTGNALRQQLVTFNCIEPCHEITERRKLCAGVILILPA